MSCLEVSFLKQSSRAGDIVLALSLIHISFLMDNTALTGVDPHNSALRCLLICCRERQDGILVNSDGYSYARYAAYIPNRSALELKNIEHSSLQGKRRRSGPER